MQLSRIISTGFAVAVMATTPLAAQAQGRQHREGFWINGGIGLGWLDCQNCSDLTNGLAWQLSLGGTLSQHLYLGASTNGWVKSEDSGTLSVSLLAAIVRVYPWSAKGFFLTGGLGIASLDFDGPTSQRKTRTGSGVILGLGYDIRVGKNVSLTPFWNGVGIDYDPGDANFGQLGLSVTLH